jgi:O-antigen/teichoic acid export membrane protein
MKSEYKDLLKKGLIYGLGSSLNGFAGFILIPFFLKRLHASEYGRFALAEMFLNMLLVLLGLGLHIPLLSRYPRVEPKNRDKLFSQIFGTLLLTTIVLESITLILYWIFFGHISGILRHELFVLVICCSFLENIWMLFSTLYRAQGAAWRFVICSLTQLLTGLIITIVLIIDFGYRENGILYGRLAGDIAVLLILAPHLICYRPRFDLSSAIDVLKIGMPLVIASFASMWISMSPRFFIERFGTIADVGVFAMSSKIANIVMILFVQPFAMAWMVSLFKIYKLPDAKRHYSRVLTYYVLLGGVVALLIAAVSPVIARLFGNADFPLNPQIILMVSMAYLASGLMYPLNIGPYVLEATTRVIPVFVIAMISSIILCWILTVRFGAIGSSWALLLVYLFQSCLLARLSNSMYKIQYEWRRLLRLIIVLLFVYLVISSISVHLTNRILLNLLWPPVIIVFISFLLFLVRFPEKTELQELRTVLSRMRLRTNNG